MPQLSQIGEIYASQLFWLAIVFALIYFGIGKAMVPRIERTMEDRSARIAGDLIAAEQASEAARAADVAYEQGLDRARGEAGQLVGTAKDDAARATERALKEADARDHAQVEAAMARIDDARRDALDGIAAVAADAAQQIVGRIAGLDPDRALVDEKVRAELAHG